MLADAPANDASHRLIRDCTFGEGAVVHGFTNLYGCEIGAGSRIGPFVEIQRGVTIGERCKVQSHSFVCDGVRIADRVFVGHGVMFVNDKTPQVLNPAGEPQTEADWDMLPIEVQDGAAIGSGAVIMGGVTIGPDALVGAGAVVTHDVEAGERVAGVPARVLP